ncbi:hypothetical protein H4582DRAFT_190509 [Lactarius indigo]|nr:hypothetical protein H4582DRAFT_190509 [Lactarius indigo]
MASILKLFHDIVCEFHFARGFVRHFFRRPIFKWFLAFLGRRLGVWHPYRDRGRGTFQKAEKAKCSSSGIGTRLESRCRMAASYIPALASHPSLHNTSSTIQQPQPAITASNASPSAPADPTVEPSSHDDHTDPSSAFDPRIHSNRRSTDSNLRSCSGDRLSIIQAHLRDSVHTSIGQPTQIPRDPLRQPRRGPSASLSRERRSRSPSAIDSVSQPRLEVDVTNLRPQTQVDNRNSPIDSPSATPHADTQLGPPSIPGFRSRRSSTTSAVVEVESPSTDSPSPRFFTDRPLPEEPYNIEHFPVVDTLDLPDGRFVQLINSEQVPRYTKEITVPHRRTYFEIPPMTTTFLYFPEKMGPEQGSLEGDCTPWVPATHPDGALYFFDQDRRIFTDTDMHDPVLREEMEDFYHHLQRTLHHVGQVIPSKNYDLVLDILPTKDGRISWSYYYACHETRCLFWLDTYHANHMISEVFGVTSPAHVRHRLEALYWTHWSLFPAVFDGRRLVPAVHDELVGILSHGCMDVMTSKYSTLPYDAETMQKMIRIIRNANGSYTGMVYHTASITRLLSFFAHWRFLHFHGQKNARLQRHKTVYHSYGERSLLITLLSPVLFLAPESHLRELEGVWVDKVIIQENWRNFIFGILKEWEQLILSSTVMLSVNVGFLAVPGVVISNLNTATSPSQIVIFTSPAQIASCMSIMASAGSIVIGLLLVRRNSAKQNEDPAGASIYLSQNTHQIFGLEPMAIVFGLPWALLMWSMVTFSIALLILCFRISNTSTRIVVSVTSALVATTIWWCIGSAWESNDDMAAFLCEPRRFFSRTLNDAGATSHRILALIDFIFSRGSHSSVAPGYVGNVRSTPGREEGGVV